MNVRFWSGLPAAERRVTWAAAYAVMPLILVGQYLRAAAIPAARRLALEHAAGYGAAALACASLAAIAATRSPLHGVD